MSSMTGLKKLLEAKAANSPMLQVDISTILTSTTFAFSEICPICCCCLSQHGQHTADAAGEVALAKQQLDKFKCHGI